MQSRIRNFLPSTKSSQKILVASTIYNSPPPHYIIYIYIYKYMFINPISVRPTTPLGLKVLSCKQYAMSYRVPKPEERARTREKLGCYSTRFAAVVGGDRSAIPEAERMLPLAFEATDGSLMLLRSNIVVVDSTVFPETAIHNRQYASLLMHVPWQDEEVQLGSSHRDAEVCRRMFDLHHDSIESVRTGCVDLL